MLTTSMTDAELLRHYQHLDNPDYKELLSRYEELLHYKDLIDYASENDGEVSVQRLEAMADELDYWEPVIQKAEALSLSRSDMREVFEILENHAVPEYGRLPEPHILRKKLENA